MTAPRSIASRRIYQLLAFASLAVEDSQPALVLGEKKHERAAQEPPESRTQRRLRILERGGEAPANGLPGRATSDAPGRARSSSCASRRARASRAARGV